jgi:hypothetical protein
MKRAVFFDKEDETFSVDIRYVLEDHTKFELFNISKGYTPAQGDTIYLMPGVNIPRAKLKDLALNQGVKIVRDADKANVIITGKATPGKVLHGSWYYTADISKIEEYIDKSSVDEYYKDNLRTALASSESDVVYFNYSTKLSVSSLIVTKTFSSNSHHYYYIQDEWKELIENCQNITDYEESELLAMINGDDAVTITNEIYTQLREMFKSSDQDNHIMAMEIMANSNYVESALYLLILLEEYGNKIAECHTKNHVNFKSMVSYFGLRVRDVDCLDPDDVSKKLTSLGLLTTEWLNILLESRIEWFIRNIASSKTFNVASIIPTPEVAIAIDTEYRAEINYDDKSNPVLEFVMGLEDAPEILVEDEVFNKEMGEIIDQIEESLEMYPITEKELAHDLYGVDNDNIEVTLKTEPVSNNNQIEETNESTDIDWF